MIILHSSSLISNVSIKPRTTLSKNNNDDCSNKLPNGCSDPSTLCFVPAGNSITVSANSPIGESGLVVNNTTLAPNDCAFQLISVNVQLNPNQIK